MNGKGLWNNRKAPAERVLCFQVKPENQKALLSQSQGEKIFCARIEQMDDTEGYLRSDEDYQQKRSL